MGAPGRWQQQARKRQAGRTGSSAATNRFACIGLALIAAFVAYAYSGHWLQSWDFYSHAVAAKATLANDYLEHTHRRKGVTFTTYSVTYTYTTPAGEFSGSDTIDEVPSGTMTVYYHSARPAASRLEYAGRFWIDTALFAIMILGCALSLFMARVYHRRVAAAKMAESEQQAA